MNIYVSDYSEELYIEEYETEWGIRYRGYSGEPSQINFSEEGWVRYYDLIKEWKKLVDKLRKSEEIVVGKNPMNSYSYLSYELVYFKDNCIYYGTCRELNYSSNADLEQELKNDFVKYVNSII